jgi:hypothetical protein
MVFFMQLDRRWGVQFEDRCVKWGDQRGALGNNIKAMRAGTSEFPESEVVVSFPETPERAAHWQARDALSWWLLQAVPWPYGSSGSSVVPAFMGASRIGPNRGP